MLVKKLNAFYKQANDAYFYAIKYSYSHFIILYRLCENIGRYPIINERFRHANITNVTVIFTPNSYRSLKYCFPEILSNINQMF